MTRSITTLFIGCSLALLLLPLTSLAQSNALQDRVTRSQDVRAEAQEKHHRERRERRDRDTRSQRDQRRDQQRHRDHRTHEPRRDIRPQYRDRHYRPPAPYYAPPYYVYVPDPFPYSSARRYYDTPLSSELGYVEEVRIVHTRRGHTPALGAITGAVLGGLIGSNIGSGSGRDAATVAGALAGGIAGHRHSDRYATRTYYAITVRLDSGFRVHVYQDITSPLHHGERVEVVGQGRHMRVYRIQERDGYYQRRR